MLESLLVPLGLIFGAYLLFVRPYSEHEEQTGGKAFLDKADKRRRGPLVESNLSPAEYREVKDELGVGVMNRY
jgi:hypothetical protein